MKDRIQKFYNECGIADYFSVDISSHLSLVNYRSGEFIYMQGGGSTKLLFLVSGKVKYYYTLKTGKDVLFGTSDKKEVIGDLEFLGMWDEGISVQALTDCTCFLIDTREIGERIKKDPVFLMSVIRKLAVRGGKARATLRASSSDVPIETRLAEHILACEVDGVFRESRRETADYLAISYRYLLMVLADFYERGILQKDGKAFIIKDRKALIDLSEQ